MPFKLPLASWSVGTIPDTPSPASSVIRPDLAKQVRAKKLSANAAAIEAGFRKRLTKFEQIVKWIPDLTSAEKRKLRGRCPVRSCQQQPEPAASQWVFRATRIVIPRTLSRVAGLFPALGAPKAGGFSFPPSSRAQAAARVCGPGGARTRPRQPPAPMRRKRRQCCRVRHTPTGVLVPSPGKGRPGLGWVRVGGDNQDENALSS
jgi:hypothetical protein